MQTLNTVGDVLSWVARYAGGTVPQESDPQYTEWLSWVNEGQEDAAERGFWSRLLTKADLAIAEDEDFAILPEDFHKRNGIWVLDVDGTDWNEANNGAEQKLFVNKNDEGEWIVTFKGFTPTADATGVLWYFRHPGIHEDADGILALDGKMIGYYALAEYFRQAGELGSLDDARAEYNNRFDENLGLEMLPSPQELLSWKPYHKFANIGHGGTYYSRGRRGRS